MNVVIIPTSHDVELSVGRDALNVKIGVVDGFQVGENFSDCLLIVIIRSTGEFS